MCAHAPLPAEILPRIGQLVRLLGSDHDGEALAACRALQRTLRAAQVDLHALAQAIESPPPPRIVYIDPPAPAADPVKRSATDYAEWMPGKRRYCVEILKRARNELSMSAWETSFVASILPALEDTRRRISIKQAEVVARIVGRMEKFAGVTA